MLNSFQFLISIPISIYCFILALRLWFQFCRVDFYHPISQTLLKLTAFLLDPLQKVIPSVKNINLSALLLIFAFGIMQNIYLRRAYK